MCGDRRGCRRSGDRARACRARPRDDRARSGRCDRHGHQFAQQRGDPRGALLSARLAEGDLMRARARSPVSILRDASRAAPARGQAAGRDERRAGEAAEGDRGPRGGKRRARPVAAHARRSADARTGARMRGSAVLARDRHRRQPSADARAARRRAARRRDVRVAIAGRVDRRVARRALRRAHRRHRADRNRGRVRRQQRGARRAGARAPHARARPALGAAALPRARPLLQPRRARRSRTSSIRCPIAPGSASI